MSLDIVERNKDAFFGALSEVNNRLNELSNRIHTMEQSYIQRNQEILDLKTSINMLRVQTMPMQQLVNSIQNDIIELRIKNK